VLIITICFTIRRRFNTFTFVLCNVYHIYIFWRGLFFILNNQLILALWLWLRYTLCLCPIFYCTLNLRKVVALLTCIYNGCLRTQIYTLYIINLLYHIILGYHNIFILIILSINIKIIEVISIIIILEMT
jgi:hypothetical protein